MRFHPDWGIGPPIAHLEERRLLRYRRVVVPASRVEWYKASFQGKGLFRPQRSCPNRQMLSNKGRRVVIRFDDAVPLGPKRPGVGSRINGSSSVHAPPRPVEATQGLVLKEERYPFPTFLHGLITVPRAEREFHNLLALRSLGFPAVEPIACGHSGLWILYHRSFLITRELQGAVNLKTWAKGRAPQLEKAEIREAMLAFAADLAKLHRARCYLRTLYGKNLLVQRTAEGKLELTLCDVPRLWWHRGRGLSFGLAARDLASLDKWARLVFGPRDRLTFLRAYLEKLGEGPPLRRWVTRVVKHRERLRHQTPMTRLSRRFKRLVKRLHLENYWPF